MAVYTDLPDEYEPGGVGYVSDPADFYGTEQPSNTVLNNINQVPQALPLKGVVSDNLFNFVDIIKDFDWTLSTNRKQIIDQIPYIELREFKLNASNAVDSVFNACSVIAQSVKDSKSAIANTTLGSAIGTASNTALNAVDWINQATGSDTKLSEVMSTEMGKSILDKFNRSYDAISNLLADQPSVGYSNEFQSIFNNLYSRTPTGVKYKFPYFTDRFISISNYFSKSTDVDVTVAAEKLSDMLEKSAKAIPSLLTPGVYVETPKFYNFSSGTAVPIIVSFTLYNTITPDAYTRNSKFIQQFTIKNSPRRFTKVVAEPPCIYEVTIPGKAFYPYCHVQSFEVRHIGTKRVITDNNQTEIIPEGYEISIVLMSLTADTSNMYETQMYRHEITPARTDSGRVRSGAIVDAISNFGASAKKSTQPENNTGSAPTPNRAMIQSLQ